MAGTLTRTQMATEVLDNLTYSGTAQAVSSTTLSDLSVRWLNRAQMRIARAYDLLYLRAYASTIDGSRIYTFPLNVRSVFTLILEDGTSSIKLPCVYPWRYDQLLPKPNETTESASRIYVPYKNSNTFELWPIPDKVYTMRLRYSYWPTLLTTTGQVSDYTNLDEIIIGYATMYGYQWMQEYSDRNSWKVQTDEDLKLAIKADLDAFPDWAPISQGFQPAGEFVQGEYYNDPFVLSNP